MADAVAKRFWPSESLTCHRRQTLAVVCVSNIHLRRSCLRTHLVRTCDQLCTCYQMQPDQHGGYRHQRHGGYGQQHVLLNSISIVPVESAVRRLQKFENANWTIFQTPPRPDLRLSRTGTPGLGRSLVASLLAHSIWLSLVLCHASVHAPAIPTC